MDRTTVVVVDVEATCWDKNRAPEGQRSEIIEIGICTFDRQSRQPDHKRSIMIAPTESKMSDFCAQLTSITQAMLDENGIPFPDACQQVIEAYDTKNRLWLSWGNYDRRMFIEQCQRRGVLYPFHDNHCNLKNLYANLYGKRVGMAQALQQLDLTLLGTHHRGDDDAWNIARILGRLLDKHGDDLLDQFFEVRED